MFNVFEGTIIGPHHEKLKEPSQDYYSYVQNNTRISLSVCDGAGSHKNSLLGATIVSEEIVKRFQNLENIEESVNEILNVKELLLKNPQSATMGTTLVSSIITNDDFIINSVGDSFAVIHYRDGSHLLVKNDDVSEFANVTELLTSNNSRIQTILGKTSKIFGISIATDGLENVSIKNGEAFNGFWTPLVNKALHGDLDITALLKHVKDSGRLLDDATLLTVIVANDDNYG